MDVVVVGVDRVEVAPAVAVVHPTGPAAGCGGLDGMTVEHPVGDVDDVDVLFHDDVAGEDTVPHPVPQATLFRRGVGSVGPLQGRREVVDEAADGLADLPVVDARYEIDVRRGVPNLEPHRQADLAVGLLAQLHHVLAARDVHGHRLLEVGVLAGGDGGLEVLGMEVRGSGDVDGVHVLAVEELLVRLWSPEHVRWVDRRLSELCGDLVERLLGGRQLALEDVANGGDHSARVLEEG